MISLNQKHKILVVDDEMANLQKLQRTFVNRYPVLVASSGREALQFVEKESDIAVIVADQRMPDMTGIDFLRQTLEPLPHAIRIILTGFTDVEVLLDAINSCKVFRYMVKPWDPPDLLMTVEAARGGAPSRRRVGDRPGDSELHPPARVSIIGRLGNGRRVSPRAGGRGRPL